MISSVAPERPILRYHGGKWVLSAWILSHLPDHRIYVEPYGGAASVLLRKERAYSEVYNDLDGEIVNLFRVVRERGHDLIPLLELTPYARDEYALSFHVSEDPLEQARRTVIRSYMGFGSNSLARAVNDTPETLHYCDPPYLHSTRTQWAGHGARSGYAHEMTDADHRAFAAAAKGMQGMVVVSGYHSELYDELFGDWRREERAALADGARERVEVLWLSPNIKPAQISLFE